MTRSTTKCAARLATLAVAMATLLAADAAVAGAQQPTRRPVRRQQPIEIRGQVPTPQVVTVRPREVPQYNRRLLVPNFYNHDFWPAILPGYQLVSRRLMMGNMRLDSLTSAGADSARMSDSTRVTAQARAALGLGLLQRPVPSTPADTTRRAVPPAPAANGANPTTGGTPPASGPR